MPFPAAETIPGAFRLLIQSFAAKSDDGQMVLLVDEYDKPLLGHLAKPDVTAFRDALKSFCSTIKTSEGLQRFTFLTGIGMFVHGEVQTADGLVDMTVETPTDVYLIEFKLDDTVANAIAQIREKNCAAPFALSQKRITLIGLGFSSEKRTVTDSAFEAL